MARFAPYPSTARVHLLKSKKLYLLLAILITISYSVVGYLQSQKPDLPKVVEGPTGHAYVAMLHDEMDAQLSGFGGWLPNDLWLTPGWVIDNMPNFQLGVLQVSRHSARVLRDNLTRQRTSDAVHKQTDLAYTGLANDPYKWAFPSAEGRFSNSNEALLAFQADLGKGGNFFPRADNLIQLLEIYVSELGAVTTQLLNARDSSQVAWTEIDNNFYYAQGVGWALLGMMQAVERDFAGVIRDKNAGEIVTLIIEALEESQFEPIIVTNGGKNGVLANHSNNLKVYLDDARQKMSSLITILDRG